MASRGLQNRESVGPKSIASPFKGGSNFSNLIFKGWKLFVSPSSMAKASSTHKKLPTFLAPPSAWLKLAPLSYTHLFCSTNTLLLLLLLCSSPLVIINDQSLGLILDISYAQKLPEGCISHGRGPQSTIRYTCS